MAKKTRCDECGSLLKDDGNTAADRVIFAFGGASRLSELTGIDKSSVYRWTYTKLKGGTNGSIPHANHVTILETAAKYDINITRSDLV